MSEIQIFSGFYSPPEGFERTLRIYLPDAYATEPDRRFPVLYMQDGQNVYDHPDTRAFPPWGVNSALDGLNRSGQLAPWIVVAVDHSMGRFHEYSLWDEPRADARGLGDRYVEFLTNHLKPEVDKHLRTLTGPRDTAIAGSSLGGLAALCAGLRRPDVFGRIGALSPSVMWGEGQLFAEWNRHYIDWLRIYMDVGAQEGFMLAHFWMDYARAVPEFDAHLRRLGYTGEELKFVIDPEGHHTEGDWRRRLPDALLWLLRSE